MQLTDINPLTLPSLPLHERSQLPAVPGIYFALDTFGQVQYIGRSVNLQKRWVSDHRYLQLEDMDFVTIAWLEVSELNLLTQVEAALIEWFNPPLNGYRNRNEAMVSLLGVIKWNLAYLMLDRNIKTGDLAASTGLHANTISKLKAFREMPKRLDSETLNKLCMALSCQPGDLMTWIPDNKEVA